MERNLVTFHCHLTGGYRNGRDHLEIHVNIVDNIETLFGNVIGNDSLNYGNGMKWTRVRL